MNLGWYSFKLKENFKTPFELNKFSSIELTVLKIAINLFDIYFFLNDKSSMDETKKKY